MNTEERLHKLERMTAHTAARLNAQSVVIGALVKTHQNPEQLVKALKKATEIGAVEHLYSERVTDEVRDFIQQEINDFISIAGPSKTTSAGSAGPA